MSPAFIFLSFFASADAKLCEAINKNLPPFERGTGGIDHTGDRKGRPYEQIFGIRLCYCPLSA